MPTTIADQLTGLTPLRQIEPSAVPASAFGFIAVLLALTIAA